MHKIHSFDVFDTCLVRTYAFPTDLFLTLAGEFQQTLEPLLGKDYGLIFRDARHDAEVRALNTAKGKETTLGEIWDMLASMLPAMNVRLGIEKELHTERNALYANAYMLKQVRKIRSQHGRVVFISDTYLPKHFICEILAGHGFLEEGDSCYVSSDIGLTKRSGSLYSHVLKVEAVSASDVVHFGDNNWSDYIVPRRQGIAARRFTECDLSLIEKSVLQRTPNEETEATSRLAGEMRRFRLGGLGAKNESAQHFVGSFLGPFLLAFASWVLARAQCDGVKRLYFFSRDCYALWQVASGLAGQFGNIDCRYLKVSRQSLLLPTITEISPSGMPWLHLPWEPNTLGPLLRKLELNVESAGPAFVDWAGKTGDNYDLASDKDWEMFWNLLNQEPLRSRILALVALRRAAAVQYFREQGLFDHREVAVVDLGWFLTGQGALRQILRFENTTMDVRGYYLGLIRNHRPVCDAGLAHAMFYDNPGDRSSVLGRSECLNRVMILDHVVGCSPHGTVHHYEKKPGRAIVDVHCGDNDETQSLIFRDLVGLSKQFCENTMCAAFLLPIDLQNFVDQLIKQALAHPDLRWREVVGDIKTSRDLNNLDIVSLKSPYSWDELFLSLLPAPLRSRIQRKTKFRFWPELSHISSSKSLITAMRVRHTIATGLRFIKDRIRM